MKPESVGRVLGIGLRVAGRVAGQRLSAAAEPPTATPTAGVQSSGSAPRSTIRSAARAQSNGSLARGISGFLKPFGRVGGKLWLEVTGVFFLLPVVVFVPNLWRLRASYGSGPDHRTFVASAIVVVVFLYLGVTSFWRARRK